MIAVSGDTMRIKFIELEVLLPWWGTFKIIDFKSPPYILISLDSILLEISPVRRI